MGRGGCACAPQRNKDDGRSMSILARQHIPLMTATLELRACDLLLEFLPIRKPPCKHLEILDFMTKVGHVLRGERLIWDEEQTSDEAECRVLCESHLRS